jgi:hypothetical protein
MKDCDGTIYKEICSPGSYMYDFSNVEFVLWPFQIMGKGAWSDPREG